jgi:exodeoxyribonuclease VII small subunit
MTPRGTPADTAPDAEAPPTFEASLRALEQAVGALESGGLDLDAALRSYEQGVRLLATCHAILEDAQKKVLLLTGTGPDGTPTLAPFATEGSAGREGVGP